MCVCVTPCVRVCMAGISNVQNILLTSKHFFVESESDDAGNIYRQAMFYSLKKKKK